MAVYSIEGYLQASPFGARLLANPKSPFRLDTEQDFRAIMMLPRHGGDQRIWVTFEEKYSLLCRCLELVQTHLGNAHHHYIRLMMPAGVRLPARLLAPDVTLFALGQPSHILALTGEAPVVVITDSIARTPLDESGNALTITWRSPQANAQAMRSLAAAVASLGLQWQVAP